MSLTTIAPFDTLLLDIEGTTTSIAFVYDVLFPYARRELGGFIASNFRDEAVQQALAATDGQPTAGADAATKRLLELMDADVKDTGLKAIQGMVWRAGYRSGEVRGHVYSDVSDALTRWTQRGAAVHIYSSGSVAAQKLLFAHSEAGDLTPFLSGHFDTTTGPKKVASSYRAIADAVGQRPSAVLFITDNIAEADAAAEAGVNVLLSVRPGNAALPPDHPHPMVATFDAIP